MVLIWSHIFIFLENENEYIIQKIDPYLPGVVAGCGLVEEIIKGIKETFGRDVYVYCLDRSDGFTVECISQNLKFYMPYTVYFIKYPLYFDKSITKSNTKKTKWNSYLEILSCWKISDYVFRTWQAFCGKVLKNLRKMEETNIFKLMVTKQCTFQIYFCLFIT